MLMNNDVYSDSVQKEKKCTYFIQSILLFHSSVCHLVLSCNFILLSHLALARFFRNKYSNVFIMIATNYILNYLISLLAPFIHFLCVTSYAFYKHKHEESNELKMFSLIVFNKY